MRRFDFEDDLFAGPVYKRFMWTALFLGPASPKSTDLPESVDDSNPSSKPKPLGPQELAVDEQISDMSSILRQSEYFSLSCKNDLEELRGLGRKPTLRHLPVANTVARERMGDTSQSAVDMKYLTACKTCDADSLADALDAGADLDSRDYREYTDTKSDSSAGQNAIELCIGFIRQEMAKRSRHNTVTLDLLLLYHETQILTHRADVGKLLHDAIDIGSVTLLNRLPVTAETMRMKNRAGNSPFHTAVYAGERSLPCLKKLITVKTDLKPHSIRDKNGRTPLQLSIEMKQDLISLCLIQLGGTTYNLKSETPSGTLSELGLTIVEASQTDSSFWTTTKVEDPLGKLLAIALRQGRVDAVSTLRDFGVVIESGPKSNNGVLVGEWIMARMRERNKGHNKSPVPIVGDGSDKKILGLTAADVAGTSWREASHTPLFRAISQEMGLRIVPENPHLQD